jgi:hemerythrin
MPLMVWNDKFSVGVHSIDQEHKKLIELLNELHDGLAANHAKDKLGHVLDGLITYTATHFRTEEKYFAQTGYPDTAAHKKEHEALTNQVLEVQKRFKSGETGTLSMEVMNFLKRWLITHIQGSDKKYAPHLIAKGVK